MTQEQINEEKRLNEELKNMKIKSLKDPLGFLFSLADLLKDVKEDHSNANRPSNAEMYVKFKPSGESGFTTETKIHGFTKKECIGMLEQVIENLEKKL